jgi:hypothetical protein
MNEEEELNQQDSKQEFDSEVLNKLVAVGENQEGNITIEPEDGIDPETNKPLFQETDEKAKLKPGKIKKKLGKYAEKFIFDMKKNPEKYMIDTPMGMMNVEDAIKKGYDPATKDFTDKGTQEAFEESLSGISESSLEAIKRITSPDAVGMPPAQAEAMGIEGDNPMVAGATSQPGMEEEMPQQGAPDILAALGGGQ